MVSSWSTGSVEQVAKGPWTHGFILTMRPARSEDGSAHGWTDYATRTVWVNSSLMTGCPDGPVRATRNAQ